MNMSACRMISAWDTFFEVDEYYTYKKPVGHGAYGVVISALDTRDNSKVIHHSLHFSCLIFVMDAAEYGGCVYVFVGVNIRFGAILFKG